jgi:hypothetical protein
MSETAALRVDHIPAAVGVDVNALVETPDRFGAYPRLDDAQIEGDLRVNPLDRFTRRGRRASPHRYRQA